MFFGSLVMIQRVNRWDEPKTFVCFESQFLCVKGTLALGLYGSGYICLFVVSAVHFAPYLTGLSSMMLI